MNSAERVLSKAVGNWAPPPDLSLSQWADTYRRTSREASAEVGQWRTRPYQREPLDAFTDPKVRCIVIMSGVQMLKTELVLCAIGYAIHLDPGPILLVNFRDTDCRKFSKTRLAPMVRDTPVLRGLVAESKSRDAGNTVDYKTFPGGHLSISASGSPGNLAAQPIRYLFCDEIDKYPASAGGEGDPISLAEGRLAEFRHNSKEILACSPTIANFSRIEKAYAESDKREYEVPCPEPTCGQFQVLKFSQVKWDDTLPSQRQRADSAIYVCEHCKVEWDDRLRWKAIEKGRYRATGDFSGIAGFRISSLCSIKKPLRDIVLKFLRSQGDVERLKTFVNTELAETWTDQGEAPDHETLLARREDYLIGTIPRGGLFVTAGVDVQRDRLEVEMVAWGRGRESWSVDYRIIEGRTSEPAVWAKLEAALGETFLSESGAPVPISRVFVDSGDGLTTNDVYCWVRGQAPGRISAIKGISKGLLPVGQPSPVDVTVAGKKIRAGLNIRTVLVDFFKAELYSDLKRRQPTDEERAQGWTFPPGYCHFPKMGNYGDEHFRQLTAEQLITRKDKRGRTRREWSQTRPRNEALDCRIYARAAAWEVGMDRFQERHWAALEEQLGTAAAKAKPVETPKPQPVKQERIEQKERWIPKRTNWFDR